MKVVIIFFTIVLILGSIGAAFYYSRHSFKSQDDLNKERYARMLSEEGWQKAKVRIDDLEVNLNNLKIK